MTRERSNRSHWLHCLQPSHMAPILSVCESACTRETPVKGGSTKTTPASQLILWPCADHLLCPYSTTSYFSAVAYKVDFPVVYFSQRLGWIHVAGNRPMAFIRKAQHYWKKSWKKKPLQTWPQKQKCLFPPEQNAPWATGNGLEREATANMRKSLSIQSLQARENNYSSIHYTAWAREHHFKS